MVWPSCRIFRSNVIYIRLKKTLSTLPNCTESKDDDIVKKLIYSSHLSNEVKWKRFLALKKATKEWRQNRLRTKEFVPSVSLQYFTKIVESNEPESLEPQDDEGEIESPPFTMPFRLKVIPTTNLNVEDVDDQNDSHNIIRDGSTVSVRKTWTNDYQKITDNVTIDDELDNSWVTKYGTSNSDVPSSKIPCGGCGANLHCRNSSIPGFIPQEVFTECKTSDLRMLVCQRCYFLQNHNTALSAAVDPSVYPNIVSQIKRKQALVLLAIDTTDFPCSIWPGLVDLIGVKSPLFLVGNKVDLLSGDTKGWLTNVEKSLKSYFRKANVIGVQLISAKTGFGVEELISKLHENWNCQGDVYLVGCTNVGKSTLFNALLQSDYCKSKAVNLVQRATTAPWPGTTINLLKFPILRPEGWRIYLRSYRLRKDKTAIKENTLMMQQMSGKNPDKKTPPQLIGHIGRTFHSRLGLGEDDSFSSPDFDNSKEPVPGSGLNPKDPDFVRGRWFYDTPGVLHNASILDLLTTDELMKVLPNTVIEPRTFVMKPGWTLFVAGLSRVDYVEGPLKTVRWTIFASKKLPITICSTDVADEVYNKLLGTETLAVPQGDSERLKHWPLLKCPEVLKFSGISSSHSCADLILSSCGWISLTPPTKEIISVKPWTPDGRGIFVRSPALLPYAVTLRGSLRKGTPVYYRSSLTNKSHAHPSALK